MNESGNGDRQIRYLGIVLIVIGAALVLSWMMPDFTVYLGLATVGGIAVGAVVLLLTGFITSCDAIFTSRSRYQPERVDNRLHTPTV